MDYQGTFKAGDGVSLLLHTQLLSGTFSNELATPADLNETSLEQAMIDIAGLTDERGLKIAARATKDDYSINVTIHCREINEISAKSWNF